MRKLFSLLAGLLLVLNLVGCSSNDSIDDDSLGEDAIAESTEATDADLENLDAPLDEAIASNEGGNEGFLDEQLPEDALGESLPSETTTADSGMTGDELTLEDAPPPPAIEDPSTETASIDNLAPTEAPAETPSGESFMDTPTDTSMAAVDTGSTPPPEEPPSTLSEPTPSTDTLAGLSEEPKAPEAPKPTASLQKVEPAPFTRKGVLLNAVYLARPGDTYKKISQTIYGDSSKRKELAKVNPSVKKPHPGTKIYYNSPVRPTDDTKLLTFFEDVGMMPEVYVAKEGDNIRQISKDLLGYDNAWKEIWATNTVDSKGELTAGTELRYWKTVPAQATPPSTEIAAAEALPPPVEPVMEQAPMPELPPPPTEMAPPTMAQTELPPPPPMEMEPPPPPPAADLPPPPPAEAMNPPPPPPVAKKAIPTMTDGEMDQDMMMSLAGAGIIAAGLAAIIIIRKRRQNRDMATAFNDTQVGT